MSKIKFIPIILTERQIELFWRKVNVVDQNLCWDWKAGCARRGYGSFAIEFSATKKIVHYQSHRVAWFLTHGEIPMGLLVCHKCDNPKCCNPSHLFLGTPLQNAHDKIKKGRSNPTKGESHGMAKLTELQITQIRYRYAAGGISLRVLAEEFCINKASVYSIIKRRTWAHVQ